MSKSDIISAIFIHQMTSIVLFGGNVDENKSFFYSNWKYSQGIFKLMLSYASIGLVVILVINYNILSLDRSEFGSVRSRRGGLDTDLSVDIQFWSSLLSVLIFIFNYYGWPW